MPAGLSTVRRAVAVLALAVVGVNLTHAAVSAAPAATVATSPGEEMPAGPVAPSELALRETRALPLTGLGALVVDDARGRLYVVGGTKLAVLDLDGRLLQVLDGLSNPYGAALLGSTLYVAQANGVLTIDVGGAAVRLGRILAPTPMYDLTPASGALWGTSGCGASAVLTKIALDGTVRTFSFPSLTECGPAAASGTGLVIATAADYSSMLLRVDLGVDPPVVVASTASGIQRAAGVSLTADGNVLYVEDGGSFGQGPARAFDAHTLAPLRTYGTEIAHAVATSANGLLAIGRAGAGNLSVYDGASTSPRWTVSLGSAYAVVGSRGLGFDASGRRVYAAYVDSAPLVSLAVLGTDDPVVRNRGEFHPIDPARAYDSRTGERITRTEIALTGAAGMPATGVSAVAVNVTVTDPVSAGYLSVFPAGQQPPNASTLNFTEGRTVPNMAIVGVGAGGRIGLFSSAPTHVVVDVVGWFGDDAAPNGARFHAIVPFRWFDTRTGARGDGRIRPVGEDDLVFASATEGAPTTSAHLTAVALNVTATNTTAASYLAVTPFGAPRGSSNLNWRTGDVVPNAVISKVDPAQGRVQFRNAFGSVDVLADSTGYWDDGSMLEGSRLEPIEPRRLVDTRTGRLPVGSTMGSVLRLAPGQALSFKADSGLPAGASSVVLNVTAVNPDTAGYLSVFPLGVPVAQGMQTSLVNFGPGDVRPNMSIMPVGLGGEIVVVNASAGSIDVLVDITGYFV